MEDSSNTPNDLPDIDPKLQNGAFFYQFTEYMQDYQVDVSIIYTSDRSCRDDQQSICELHAVYPPDDEVFNLFNKIDYGKICGFLSKEGCFEEEGELYRDTCAPDESGKPRVLWFRDKTPNALIRIETSKTKEVIVYKSGDVPSVNSAREHWCEPEEFPREKWTVLRVYQHSELQKRDAPVGPLRKIGAELMVANSILGEIDSETPHENTPNEKVSVSVSKVSSPDKASKVQKVIPSVSNTKKSWPAYDGFQLFIIGLVVVGTFIGCWIYSVALWGWFVGLAFGWIPSAIIAFIFAKAWPLFLFLALLAGLIFWAIFSTGTFIVGIILGVIACTLIAKCFRK